MNDRPAQRARDSFFLFLAAASSAVAVACGGHTASSAAATDASTTVSPGPTPDAGGQQGATSTFDAGVTGSLLEDAGDDSGTATSPRCDGGSLVGRVPVSHRPSGSTCPPRAPGSLSGCSYDGGVPCVTDGDCTAGSNGRCTNVHVLIPPPPPGCPPPQCSYDDCESDTDCPAGVPCDCRGSSFTNAPNVCATGSNCRTDSDCGPGGYCSPGGYSGFACGEPTFFCHGPADTCIDDTDCCGAQRQCMFDTALGHFACSYGCVPPP